MLKWPTLLFPPDLFHFGHFVHHNFHSLFIIYFLKAKFSLPGLATFHVPSIKLSCFGAIVQSFIKKDQHFFYSFILISAPSYLPIYSFICFRLFCFFYVLQHFSINKLLHTHTQKKKISCTRPCRNCRQAKFWAVWKTTCTGQRRRQCRHEMFSTRSNCSSPAIPSAAKK